MATSDEWERANFKPDTTDKAIPDIRVRTNRLVVDAVGEPKALSITNGGVFVRNLRIKAERKNKGIVFIGSGVSVDLRINGYPLDAGEELPLEVNDLTIVFFQGDTKNDAIRIIYGS